MNSQERMNLLKQVMTLLGGLLAGAGIINAAQAATLASDVLAAVPALVSIASIAWSVYAHYKMVKVPAATVISVPGKTSPVQASTALKSGILAIAIILCAAALVAPAMAATKTTRVAAKATTTSADPLATLMSKLDTVSADIITGTIADIQAADADAAVLTNSSDPTSFKDPISHACYPAEVKFLQSLPQAVPLTGGKYVLVQLFQRKRDFVNGLRAGIPAYLKLGCSALLGDEAQVLVTSLGLVGISVALPEIAPLLPAASLLPSLPALSL